MTGLLSPAHIAVLLVVLLLVFGAKRLPELGQSLGSGMREFKHSLAGEPGAEQPSLASADPPGPIANASAAAQSATTTIAQPVPIESPATRPAA
jgi:sec-independent protein translocase protein TatA